MEDNTMPRDERHTATIPYGTLGIVPLKSCSKMGEKVDDYLVQWREQREHENQSNLAFSGYKRDSYVVSASTPRFGSGEGKGVLNDSIRGYDLYIMVDVCNYSIEYSLCGTTNHMSPDDHYADLKRVIAAAGGKARRINVICLSFMKADSTKDQEENLLIVHLCFRNLQPWALKILSHLMHMTLEYTIQFLLRDLNQYLVLISSSSIFYLVLTTFTSTANI